MSKVEEAMKVVSPEKLIELLKGIGNKAPFVGLDVETIPKTRAGAPPLVKQSTITGRAGARFNPKMEDYEYSPRAWGQRIKGSPLVEYKGVYYLEIDVIHVKEIKFLAKKEEWEEISPIEALTYMYSKGAAKVHEGFKDYKISSIKKIRFGGEEYLIR